MLNVDERRVTNTYQSVVLPEQYVQLTEVEMADRLTSSFGVEIYGYLLFFGALEPKKNISRLMDAYLSSNVSLPLLIVGGEGWQTDAEQKLLLQLQEAQRSPTYRGRRIQRINYVTQATLITLIRGACAVVFPSLYEGFGLPVLEAMSLGTPVITSTESSVPEVAGDAAILVDPYDTAAILVDPYDTAAITRAINTVVSDDGMRAELSRRGKLQAAKFSLDSLPGAHGGILRVGCLIAPSPHACGQIQPQQNWVSRNSTKNFAYRLNAEASTRSAGDRIVHGGAGDHRRRNCTK